MLWKHLFREGSYDFEEINTYANNLKKNLFVAVV